MKSIYLALVLLSSFVLFPIISDAQNTEEEESFTLSGKVIDAATLKGIPFSHIKIDNTYWGVICDSLGFFRVSIKSNQSLKVSSLSYAELVVPITSEVTDGEAFQEISLNRTSYMLEEVDIYSLGTWAQFKENFVKMELPDDSNVAGGWNFGNLKLQLKEAIAMNRGGAGMSISMGGRYTTRKEIIQGLTSRGIKRDKLALKFNRKLVQDMTHEKGVRLQALMAFIIEREHFTYQTRDVYIQRRIKACYDTFILEYVEGEYEYALDDTTKTLRNRLRK